MTAIARSAQNTWQTMISIREEIDEIVNGNINPDSNLVKNAPHTLNQCSSDKWNFNYSRKDAAFPLQWVRDNKFWPSVRRIDQAYGDRNLVCSCPEIQNYKESTCDI